MSLAHIVWVNTKHKTSSDTGPPPQKPKCNTDPLKKSELSPADQTAQALKVKELWWAGCTALFSRSVTYWWSALLAPLWSPLHPLPLAVSRVSGRPASGGRLPSGIADQEDLEQEAFLSMRCDPPPADSCRNSSGSISASPPLPLWSSQVFTSRWPKL